MKIILLGIIFTCFDLNNFTKNVKMYSVSHIITYPSKELCSKMALREVGMSLP